MDLAENLHIPAPPPDEPAVPDVPVETSQRIDVDPPIMTGPRRRRLPARLDDFVVSSRSASVSQLERPRSPSPEPVVPQETYTPPPPSPSPPPEPIYHDTKPDDFGMYRRYKEIPSRDSDETLADDYGCNAPTFQNVETARTRREIPTTQPVPESVPIPNPDSDPQDIVDSVQSSDGVLNRTVQLLMKWWYSTPTKSQNDLQNLVDDVILDDNFDRSELADFNASKVLKQLKEPAPASSDGLPLIPPCPGNAICPAEGWTNSSVRIRLPHEGHKFTTEEDAPEVEIKNVYHRSILGGIVSAFQGKSFYDLHLKGFIQMWKPSDSEPAERVRGEVYWSEECLEMADNVRETIPEDTNLENLEVIVAPLLWYSDSASLASFGTASLWSVFQWVGLLSKYIRGKLSSFSAYHLAYIPSVSFHPVGCYVSQSRCSFRTLSKLNMRRYLVHLPPTMYSLI